MIRLVKISFNQLEPLILLSYRDDEIGLDRYHVAKFSLEEAVWKTYSMIREEKKTIQLEFYKILYKNEQVGYTVGCKGLLYSFGFKLSARTKEVVLPWWTEIRKVIGSVFECALYSNNTRAINFLKRRGMRVVSVNTKTKMVKLLNQ